MRRSLLVAIIITGAVSGPSAEAAKILGGGIIERGTVQTGFWCPSELNAYNFDGRFVADGPEVTIIFTALNQSDDGWMHQAIDNVAIVERSVYDAFLASVEADSLYCILNPEDLFYFHSADSAGLVLFLDQFHDSVSPGWDLDDGGYFLGPPYASAPNNLYDPHPDSETGGSLGIGVESNPAQFTSTRITLTGLTEGTEYVLSFWWHALLEFAFVLPDLEVQILGTERWTEVQDDALNGFGDSVSAAWVDLDADGDLDLYIAEATSANRLLRNEGDRSFAEMPAGELADPAHSISSDWADYDGDGDLDLYQTNLGATPNRLLRNDGGWTFADVTSGPLGAIEDSRVGIWGDYDLDGDLDVFVAQSGAINRLIRNDGGSFVDMHRFTDNDATEDANWIDYDNDGDLDLYLVNNGGDNALYRNEGGWFAAVPQPFLTDGGQGRAASWGDHDNDGNMDLYLARLSDPDRLYHNDGGGVFSESTPPVTAELAFGLAASWIDYDNDADLDLYVVDGVQDASPNKLYRNDGGIDFVDVADPILEHLGPCPDAVWGDYDGDGDLDLYILNLDSSGDTNRLIENTRAAEGNHWLAVDLAGTVSNASGIGARIELEAGGVFQVRDMMGSRHGWASFSPLTAHFGLGAADVVDVVRVRWPSGVVQELHDQPVDGRITITEPDLIYETHFGVDTCGELDPNLVWEPGETIELGVTLHAAGDRAHTGISGSLSTNAPGVTVTTSSANWPDATVGSSVQNLAPFRLYIDREQAVCLSEVELELTVSSNEGSPSFFRFTEQIGQTPSALDVPRELADGSMHPITSELVVSQPLALDDLDVFVAIEHTWVGDLKVFLEGPDGIVVTLLDRPGVPGSQFGCDDDNLVILFDDDSGFDLETHCEGTNPWYDGTAAPLEPLSVFDGTVARGTWRLRVEDHFGGDGGTLVSWGLLTSPPLDDVCETCDAVSVSTSPSAVGRFLLAQNRPNPFNPSTTISFELVRTDHATLTVFDVSGRRVTTLVDERLDPGAYRVRWDGRDAGGRPVATGVYFYRLESGGATERRRMSLVR